MQAHRFVIATIASAILGAAQAQTVPDAPTLFHPISMPAKLSWGAVSVDLGKPEAWRVGSIDGPPAGAAELRSVLSHLTGIEIGGVCRGWVEGPTVYPCGFAVRNLDIGGERFSAIAYDAQPPDAEKVRATSNPRPDLVAAGLIAPALDAPRFVAVRVPERLLGDRRGSFGHTMAFDFRAVSNALVPSVFDRGSAVVILRSGAGSAQAGSTSEHVAAARTDDSTRED